MGEGTVWGGASKGLCDQGPEARSVLCLRTASGADCYWCKAFRGCKGMYDSSTGSKDGLRYSVFQKNRRPKNYSKKNPKSPKLRTPNLDGKTIRKNKRRPKVSKQPKANYFVPVVVCMKRQIASVTSYYCMFLHQNCIMAIIRV